MLPLGKQQEIWALLFDNNPEQLSGGRLDVID
jgi:hypothetical protein